MEGRKRGEGMGVELAGFQKQGNIYVLLLGKITAIYITVRNSVIRIRFRIQYPCYLSKIHRNFRKSKIFYNNRIYSTTYSFQWLQKYSGRMSMRIWPDPDP
jgi:hypothetical protein